MFMHSAQPLRFTSPTAQAVGAHERRRRAAWIDYLRSIRAARAPEYEEVEANSWEQLQRRLRRNDELLEQSRG